MSDGPLKNIYQIFLGLRRVERNHASTRKGRDSRFTTT